MNQFIILGTLRSYALEFKGKNGDFPIVTVEIQTGEKFYQAEITGSDSVPFQALFEQMPVGTAISASVGVTGRRKRDGGTFGSLKLLGAQPDFSGRVGTVGTLSGIIAGVEEKPGRSGSFKVPKLSILSADRDGLLTHDIEVRFSRDDEKTYLPIFEGSVGQYAEVECELDAFITDKGGSITKFQAKKVTAQPLPEYLESAFGVQANAELGADADLDAAV